jgi:hypothetical protein
MRLETERLQILEFNENMMNQYASRKDGRLATTLQLNIAVKDIHGTTEAINSFLPAIMTKLHIKSIYGICHKENIASQKVLNKAGFTLIYDGISDYHGGKHMVHKYIYNVR